MGKKIDSKFFAVKRTGEGTNVNVDFVPKVKAHTAPLIMESYISDEGNIIHILENGNELSDVNYLFHWGKKGVPNFAAVPVKINPNPHTKTHL